MATLHEIALLSTVGFAAWIALDVGLDRSRRQRLNCVLALSLATLAWSAGDLLVRHASSPAEVIVARRILYAGICALPASWVWCAWIAAHPGTDAFAKRLFVALLAPGLAAYACLYVAPGGLFVDWYAVPVRHGPLFFANVAYSWLLIGVGAVLVLGAMRRSPDPSWTRIGLMLAVVLLPMLANVSHLILRATPWDLTPVALGFSALAFRLFVVDLTWGAYHSPAARAEVVEQMRTGVLVADLAGRVVDWNEAAEGILRARKLEGRPLRRLLAEASAARVREIEVYEFPLERRGQRFGTGAVVTDRTEIRRAELRLEMTTRVEALGYLATGVAHEINNPLTYVSANLVLLDELVSAFCRPELQALLPAPLRSLAEEGEELIADAREGTERIQRIVERLSQSAANGDSSQVPSRLDVRYVVEKAVALASLGKHRGEIQLEATNVLPPVVAPEMDVIQTVLHLLHNAAQMGGKDVPIAIALRAVDGGVAIRVEDGGPGISERDLPHVFEPFFTTRRPGAALGLGLSMCWELARRSGGSLDVENGPEQGAVFTLWLPAAPTA
jgi:signal transduction histidine kinase